MENTGQKRVMSFEEFMEMGAEDTPMFVKDEQPIGQDADINLDKGSEEDDFALTMMDEPQSAEEPASEEPASEEPENEEPVADESAEFWSLD